MTSKQKSKLLALRNELDAMDGRDPESDHSRADDVLLEALETLNALSLVRAYRRRVESSKWWSCG